MPEPGQVVPIAVSGGVTLQAVRYGPARGPVAFLHPGAGADHLTLSLLARHLGQRGYAAWVLNSRGIAGSDTPSDGYNLLQFTADAIAVLEHAGGQPAVVIGQSLGSAVAQQMALARPDLVGSLVLLATWAHSDPFLRYQFSLSQTIVASDTPSALLYLIASRPLLNDEPSRRGLERGMFTGRRALAPEMLARQLAIGQDHDSRSVLGSLEVPTLVLSGDHDLMIPAVYGEEVASLIPGSRHHLLCGARASHLFHWEMASEVHQVIDAFVPAAL
ncbi:MAG: alpha/beta fold hydrolase [Sulfobacillus sp.]